MCCLLSYKGQAGESGEPGEDVSNQLPLPNWISKSDSRFFNEVLVMVFMLLWKICNADFNSSV